MNCIRRGVDVGPEEIAKNILGVSNVFGLEQAMEFFGYVPSRGDLDLIERLGRATLYERFLRKNKDRCVAVLRVSTPIQLIQERHPDLFASQEDSWYRDLPEMRASGVLNWHLMAKEPLAGSLGKSYIQGCKILEIHQDIPPIDLVVYTMVAVYLSTGQRMFNGVLVRTSTTMPDGNHLAVGFDNTGKIVIPKWHNDNAMKNTALAVEESDD